MPAIFRDATALLITAACTFGSMSFGYDTGIGGGVIALSSFQRAFYGAALTVPARADLSSNVVSVLFLGAFVAAIASGFTSKYLGRKLSLQMAALIFLLGAFIQIGQTSNIDYIYGGRVVSGIGIGYISALCPVFIAETAPSRFRGACTCCFQLGLVTGGMLAYFVTYGCSLNISNTDNFQWRFPLAFQAVPAGILFFLLFLCPESPRWLVGRGRDEQALKALARLRGRSIEDAEVRDEFAAMAAQVREQQSGGLQGTWKEKAQVLLRKGNWNRLLLGYYMAVGLIWNGSNSILYYAPTVFASVGYTGQTQSLLASGILTIVKVACTIVLILFGIERFKRRTLLITGSVFSAFFLLLLGGLLAKYPPTATNRPSSLQGGFSAVIYLFIVSYSLAVAALSWVVIAEIFNPATKQFGLASSVALIWLMNYAIGKATPLAIVSMGYGWWLFLGVLNVLLAVGYYFIPETKGVTTEEMDLLFRSVDHETREKNISAFAQTVHHDGAGSTQLRRGSSSEDEEKKEPALVSGDAVVVAATQV